MTKSETPPHALRECALCGQRRAHGGLLRMSDTDDAQVMWVCKDCQHQLTLQVDDSARGGMTANITRPLISNPEALAPPTG